MNLSKDILVFEKKTIIILLDISLSDKFYQKFLKNMFKLRFCPSSKFIILLQKET